MQNNLYYNQSFPKIHNNVNVNEITSVSSIDSEWCLNQKVESLVVIQGQDEVQAEGVSNNAQSSKECPQVASASPPDELPAFQAVHWPEGLQNVDLRPHLWDAALQEFLLIDSGSQITATCKRPGDKIDNSVRLIVVNGSRINTYLWCQKN